MNRPLSAGVISPNSAGLCVHLSPWACTWVPVTKVQVCICQLCQILPNANTMLFPPCSPSLVPPPGSPGRPLVKPRVRLTSLIFSNDDPPRPPSWFLSLLLCFFCFPSRRLRSPAPYPGSATLLLCQDFPLTERGRCGQHNVLEMFSMWTSSPQAPRFLTPTRLRLPARCLWWILFQPPSRVTPVTAEAEKLRSLFSKVPAVVAPEVIQIH